MKNKIYSIMALALTTGIVVSSFLGCDVNKGARLMAIKEQKVRSLLDKCNKKSAGSDEILSIEESIKFARALDYRGGFLPDEYVILKPTFGENEWPHKTTGILYIGYKSQPVGGFGSPEIWRDSRIVSIEQMEKYLVD